MPLLVACGPQGAELIWAVPVLAGGAAIGGIGYFVSDRPDIEFSGETRRMSLRVGQVKALHFQLRIPERFGYLDQKVTLSAEPAGLVALLDPEFNIGESIASLPDLPTQVEGVTRYRNTSLPRVKALAPGKVTIRVNALGSSRTLDITINP